MDSLTVGIFKLCRLKSSSATILGAPTWLQDKQKTFSLSSEQGFQSPEVFYERREAKAFYERSAKIPAKITNKTIPNSNWSVYFVLWEPQGVQGRETWKKNWGSKGQQDPPQHIFLFIPKHSCVLSREGPRCSSAKRMKSATPFVLQSSDNCFSHTHAQRRGTLLFRQISLCRKTAC